MNDDANLLLKYQPSKDTFSIYLSLCSSSYSYLSRTCQNFFFYLCRKKGVMDWGGVLNCSTQPIIANGLPPTAHQRWASAHFWNLIGWSRSLKTSDSPAAATNSYLTSLRRWKREALFNNVLKLITDYDIRHHLLAFIILKCPESAYQTYSRCCARGKTGLLRNENQRLREWSYSTVHVQERCCVGVPAVPCGRSAVVFNVALTQCSYPRPICPLRASEANSLPLAQWVFAGPEPWSFIWLFFLPAPLRRLARGLDVGVGSSSTSVTSLTNEATISCPLSSHSARLLRA